MRELFDRLIADGEAGIDRLVTERTQESVTLDFKKKVDASNGRPEDQDKRVLAKAMSAFANSAGGLIVYGVHGVPGPDGVDCAQAARPIAEIERFVSALHELSGELLQPRHSGIQIGMIQSERTEGAGYAVVNVERSERRPHRSEAKDQKQYFKRGGSKSYAMEHYDIEDAFRRISAPSLMFYIVKAGSMSAGDITHQIALQLLNDGQTTAKYPYIHLSNGVSCNFEIYRGPNFQANKVTRWTTYNGGADHVINPGISVVAGYMTTVENGSVLKDALNSRKPGFLSFDWRFGCENVRMKEGHFEIEWSKWPDGNVVVAM